MRDDLHRTNINLHRDDVDYLRNLLGFGWTEKVREIVHAYVIQAKDGGSLEAESIWDKIKVFDKVEELPNGITLFTGGKITDD